PVDPENPTIVTVTFSSTATLNVDGEVAIYTSSDVTFGHAVGNVKRPTSLTVHALSGDVLFQSNASVKAVDLYITAFGLAKFSNSVSVTGTDAIIIADEIDFDGGTGSLSGGA